MINIKYAEEYCTDYTKIENYEKALNDDTQTWICHHKNGILLNCGHEKLIELGLYYDRPPEELIFVTFAEHNKLHFAGKPGPNKGVPCPEKVKTKLSILNSGDKNPSAKQCYINGKSYGCIKDAWRDICPDMLYKTFLNRYNKGLDVTVKPKDKKCTINSVTYCSIKDAWRDINPYIPYNTFKWRYKNNKL